MGPFRDRVHTLTADNSKEFAGHQVIFYSLGASIYFATLYHSWERDLNEHTNDPVRQYFSKRTDLSKVAESQIQVVESWINHQLRQVLTYRILVEVSTGVPA